METQVREHNLPLPKNQKQEVLYELLTNPTVSRADLWKAYYIHNAPDVIFKLRQAGLDIVSIPRKLTTKFGKNVSISLYRLADRKRGIELYGELA